MARLWRHFGEWATALRSDLFTFARLKLSALYIVIIIVILALFTIGIEVAFRDRLRENQNARRPEERAYYDRAIDDIQNTVLLVDASIIILSAGASYALAGYTLQPIKKALEAQTAFAADASHELRTPLAIMRTNTEIILKNRAAEPEVTQKLLQANLEEITSVSAMTEQLLALSRGQELKKSAFERVNFVQLVKDTGQKFANLARQKNIHLTVETIERVSVSGDVHGLERLLKNILANAITYTPDHGSITMSLRVDQGIAIVTVVDTGIGIPAKDLPHIFERFYKVDTARTTTESGSGLGLAIVKQIIEQHDGTVEVQSTPGLGTRVTIRLPAM